MDPLLFENITGQENSDNPIVTQRYLGEPTDPLALEIDDDELIKILDEKVKTDKKFWNGGKYNLATRRRRMENALFGRNISEMERLNQLKRYEARYSNNKLYEIEASLKPVAMSKLPDMLVTPGTETPESEKSAEDVSKAINDDLKTRKNREVLGLGFKHLPVYFTAIVKARWNPELGEDGDYEFVNVHPDRIILDSTATTKDQRGMRTIVELVRLTVQDIIMRFPNSKDALYRKLREQGLAVGEGDFAEEDMATEVDIWEVWFTWYKKAGSNSDMPQAPGAKLNDKWERVEGVLWKYDTVMLKKTKNPTYDYQGEERWFVYDDPSMENTKRPLTQEELITMALTGQSMDGIKKEQIYFNYFKEPQKPYYFFGYDQWGKVAIDETSRIEQNQYNQENLDSMGKQIIDTTRDRTKHIWTTDSGLDAGEVQNMDMANPQTQVLIDGDINKVHTSVPAERPDAAQFNALSAASQDMFALAGATNLTGVIQSNVATTNQIAREANFTRIDDLVEDTINSCAEWMACWAMQFIKLRYTEDHFRKLLGNEGKVTFLKLKRDSIDDGMEVMIKASSSDKAKAQKNAMEAAQLGPPYVNPLDFFKDMEYSDPEGRTERGMLLATDPQSYLVKYGMGLQTTEQQAQALANAPLPQAQGVGQAPTGQSAVAAPSPVGAPAPSPNLGQQPSPVQSTAAVPTNIPPVPGTQ